jgi:tetratricopeptide (TPR) repeat protein
MRVTGWSKIWLTAVLTGLMGACTSEVVNREPMVNLTGITAGEIKLVDLNRALRQNRNNAALYAKRAKIYLDQKDLKKALADIEAAIRINDNQEEFYFWKAVILRENQQITRALEVAEEAENLGLKDPNNYLLQTELLLKKKQFPEALEKVTEALKLDPENAQGFYYKGLTRALLGDTASAIILYKRTIRTAPDLIFPYLQLGSIFNAQKDYDQANYYLKNGARLDSTNGFLWYQQGLCYAGLKMADSAYVSFAQAVKSDQAQYLANYQMGLMDFKRKNYNGAATNMALAKAQSPNLVMSTEILAESYEKTGRYKEALVEYNKILRRKPNDVRTMWGIRRSNYALYKIQRDSLNRYRSRRYNSTDTTNYNINTND